MKRTLCWFAAVLVPLTLGSPGPARPAFADPLPVFVSVAPQSYFVKKIGGERVAVSVMVPPGASPATYEPKPAQMRDLSGAALYFAVGVPFERAWLDRIRSANPAMKVIPTHEGIDRRHMAGRHDHHGGPDHGHDHGHGHGDGHGREEGIPDPHVWLSPPLVRQQARNILTALIDAAPAHRDAFEKNHAAFAAELTDLDRRIRDILAPVKNRRFMVFHPSWGYFAETYGLEQIPAEIEGKSPKPADLQRLIDLAREHHIRVIFVQPQFSEQSARIIANAVGGRVAVADPLAADWSDNLLEVARRFAEAMQ